LVLDYLDEEKYTNSYESFLNECKYLGNLFFIYLFIFINISYICINFVHRKILLFKEECKIYLKQGIALPRTIHGKKLSDYLVFGNSEQSNFITLL